MNVVGQGIAGFISGAIFAPFTEVLAGNACIAWSKKTYGVEREQAFAAGAICAGAFLTLVLESSPFITGFKVAVVATTIIAASISAMNAVSFDLQGRSVGNRREPRIVTTLFAAIGGSLCSLGGASALPLWIGTAVGGGAAYMIACHVERWSLRLD